MGSKQITGKQMQSLIILFLLGSSLVVGTPTKAKQDSWICISLAFVMALPMIFIYSRILKKYPGENFFDIVIKVFGKILGKIVCCLYVWYALHLGALVFRNFTEFMHVLALPETPSVIILCCGILICFWTVISGAKNIGSIAKAVLPVLVFFVILAILLSLKDMNINNIKPMFHTDAGQLLSCSYSVFSFPFAEAIVILPIFSYLVPKERSKKLFLKGFSISLLLLLAVNLRNLFLLGNAYMKVPYFISYQAVSAVSIGEFFTRFEAMVGANSFLAGFVKVSICLFSASSGLAKICSMKDYKPMTAPCGLILIILSTVMYKNAEEMFNWLDIYTIYAVPFQVIIPIILWITIEIKAKREKQTSLSENEQIESLE